MSKLLKFLLPVLLFTGSIYPLFAQSCICVHTVLPPIQWACIPSCGPGLLIGKDKLNTFLGPFTPEQVGNAMNISLMSSSLGECRFYTIMTFTQDQWDANGSDTRLWSGSNATGTMLNDDSGNQLNFVSKVMMPCNGDNLNLSIDFYPNENTKKAFYIFIIPENGYEGQVVPSVW